MPPRAQPIRKRSRSKADTARVYGDEARQAWLRARPCIVCGAGPVELHHTRNGGLSRKADAATLVPLCARHHREYHDTGIVRARVWMPFILSHEWITYTKHWFRKKAAELDAKWQATHPERKADV